MGSEVRKESRSGSSRKKKKSWPCQSRARPATIVNAKLFSDIGQPCPIKALSSDLKLKIIRAFPDIITALEMCIESGNSILPKYFLQAVRLPQFLF